MLFGSDLFCKKKKKSTKDNSQQSNESLSEEEKFVVFPLPLKDEDVEQRQYQQILRRRQSDLGLPLEINSFLFEEVFIIRPLSLTPPPPSPPKKAYFTPEYRRIPIVESFPVPWDGMAAWIFWGIGQFLSSADHHSFRLTANKIYHKIPKQV